MLMHLKTFLLLTTCFMLMACGTTSALISTDGVSVTLDENLYDKIMVQDFIDHTHKKQNKPQSKRRKRTMDLATQRFADEVALQIEKTGAFKQVTRQATENFAPSEDYLLVKGEITRYSPGNTLLRVIIGYGIGLAFLDAEVRLYDADTNRLIGTITVDRNSWLLGGIVAIAQSAEFFMHRSAVKIAKEIAAINVTEKEAVIAIATQ